MSREFIAEQGWFAIVQNSPTVNYLDLALIQAKSIKHTQKVKNYGIAVDQATADLLTDEHWKWFDEVVLITDDAAVKQDWKLANEGKVWHLTPWRETVKLDVDIIFPQSLDHLWSAWRQQEVCFASTVYTPWDTDANNSFSRKLFTDNNLPMAYSGITYFRYGQDSMRFFGKVADVFNNWPKYRDEVLTKCFDKEATTDVAYAIASVMCDFPTYNPILTHQGFVHLKATVLGIGLPWEEQYAWQIDSDGRITIDNHYQFRPLHMVNKNLKSTGFLRTYERVIENLC